MLTTITETFPFADFAADSRQLEDFRNSNFSSMAEEFRRVFPSEKNLVLTPVPVARKVARDMARPYVRSAQRKLTGGTNTGDLELLMASLGWDDYLLEASQIASLQQSVLFVPVPAKDGRIRLLVVRPGEAQIEYEDPLDTDPAYARQIEIGLPVRVVGHVSYFGRLILNREEAYFETPTGRQGLFAAWGHETRNPLAGRLPVYQARLATAPRGVPYPSLADDVLAIQVATVLGMTDVELTCRFQAHGRETLIGPGAKLSAAGASAVRVGAGVMLAFDELEAGTLRHELTTPQPAIDRHLAALNMGLELLERYRYLSFEDARQLEVIEEQYRFERVWRRAEQGIVDLLVEVLNLRPRLRSIEAPTVSVDYQYVERVENDLQTTQASILRYMTGADSPGELVARRENLRSAEEGWDRVRERATKNREFLAGLSSKDVPGLDSIAGAVGATTGATPPA